jgi:CDP-paratose 2-epimerase
VVDRLAELTGREVPIRTAPWRLGDQRIYVSDNGKAERLLGWRPRTHWESGLERLVEWLRSARLDTPVIPLRQRRTEVIAAAGGA